jgi:phosphatidylglycerophosphatase A
VIRLLLSTVGGLGLLRLAPGTWGSLPPVIVAVALTPAGPTAIIITMAVLAVVSSILCVVLAPWYESHFGRTDPGEVVIDEVAGMSLCLLAVAALSPDAFVWPKVILTGVMCFVLFRVLDITKPPPIGQLQEAPHGWGVLIDDLAAGLIAALFAWIIIGWVY